MISGLRHGRTAGARGMFPPIAALSMAIAVLGSASIASSDTPSQPVQARADEVLTLEEAAALLVIEPDTLASLAENGEVPGRRLGDAWRFSRTRLLEWLGTGDTAPSSRLPAGELRATRGRGPEGEPNADETVGEPPPQESASDIFLRNRRVLLAPKQLVIEPLIFYTRADTPDIQFQSFASSEGVPISLALGEAANLEQHITTVSLTGRYGLVRGVEGFGGAIFQDRRIKSETESDQVDTELRSVFLGLRATVLHEARYRPDVVIGVQGIAPTGDSSAAINGSVFAVKSADPVALFAGIEYQHTFSRDFDEPRKLEPENTFGAQVGYVFAVSEETSLNTSIQGLFVLDSEFDAGTIDSSQEFSLRLGLTQRLRHDLFVEPSVAFSLNGPGDFVTFGLRFPWIAYP